ncbi:MAG TPA: hypothetical protein VK622_07175, partial [Puia sp.]|nr:hypothetical protein [Puia sp.]
MKKNHILFLALGIMAAFVLSCETNDSSKQPGNQPAAEVKKSDSVISAANPPSGFQHAYATVNGVKIHYVTGGSGEPLILLHGFGQNWFMWNRLLPELSKHFTVVA